MCIRDRDSYVDALSDFPSSNTILDTEKGRAFCIKIDVFKKKMWFAYMDNSMAVSYTHLDVYKRQFWQWRFFDFRGGGSKVTTQNCAPFSSRPALSESATTDQKRPYSYRRRDGKHPDCMP